MSHVSDDRADIETRTIIHSWLTDSIEKLPDGDELPPSVHSEVLTRLPRTPQRRRWWPFRWFPFGIGATRRADTGEPRPERRTRSMPTATQAAAGVVILALAGSLALLAVPLEFDPALAPATTTSEPPAPAVEAFQVTGTAGIKLLEEGEDSGDTLRNRVGSNVLMEMNDSRVSGEVRFLHHADDFGLVGVQWGTYRLENDEGAWQGPLSGFYHWHETRTSGWLTGEGAYEGLTYYMESVVDHSTGTATINGVVFEGSPPTDYPQLDMGK